MGCSGLTQTSCPVSDQIFIMIATLFYLELHLLHWREIKSKPAEGQGKDWWQVEQWTSIRGGDKAKDTKELCCVLFTYILLSDMYVNIYGFLFCSPTIQENCWFLWGRTSEPHGAQPRTQWGRTVQTSPQWKYTSTHYDLLSFFVLARQTSFSTITAN